MLEESVLRGGSMKEMKRYCIGNRVPGVIIVLVLVALLIGYAVTVGASILSIRWHIVFFFLYMTAYGVAGTRFLSRICSFQNKGKLDMVINDFRNSVYFFDNESVKLGQYCIFFAQTGRIFLYEEISSVRINIVKEVYDRHLITDTYRHDYVQIRVGNKYYDVIHFSNFLNEPKWFKFQEFLRLNAPNIEIETIPATETRVHDLKSRSETSMLDDD